MIMCWVVAPGVRGPVSVTTVAATRHQDAVGQHAALDDGIGSIIGELRHGARVGQTEGALRNVTDLFRRTRTRPKAIIWMPCRHPVMAAGEEYSRDGAHRKELQTFDPPSPPDRAGRR